MSNYIRNTEGRLFFLTLVTFKRKPILTSELSRQCLRYALERVQAQSPFTTKAMCLLPDHLHFIMELPTNDKDYSMRISLIKRYFTKQYLANGGHETKPSESMTKHGNRGVWQKRFWEHKIKDEDDYYYQIKYIHRNPVKHKLVKHPADWPWSTYHKLKTKGTEDKMKQNNFNFIE